MSSSKSSPDKESQKSVSTTKNANKVNKLFISNLDAGLSSDQLEKQLRLLFEKHSKVLKIETKRNYNNLYSFAFVEFSDAESAAKVLKQCSQSQIKGRKLTIDFQKSNPRQPKQNRNYPRQSIPFNSNLINKQQRYDNRHEEPTSTPKNQNNEYNKYQKHQDKRTDKRYRQDQRSYSNDSKKDHRKGDHRKKSPDNRKDSFNPKDKYERREDNSSKNELSKKYKDEWFFNPAPARCNNCKSLNHTSRNCQKKVQRRRQSKSVSRQHKYSRESSSRRHQRSRKHPKHPQRRDDNRKKHSVDQNKKHRNVSSDYSSKDHSIQRRRVSKNIKKYRKRSSSSYSHHKSRNN